MPSQTPVRRPLESARRPLAVVLLCCWTLQGCYSLRPEPTPGPDQDIALVVLRSGARIAIPRGYRARVIDDSLVVRREGRRVDAVARTAVDSLYVRELRRGDTALAIGAVTVVAVGLFVFLLLRDLGLDYGCDGSSMAPGGC